MRKKRFIIPLVVFFVLICVLIVNFLVNRVNSSLTSCSGYSYGEEVTIPEGYFYSFCDGDNFLLKFFDFKQKKDVFVCSRPNCDHKNPDTCNAIVSGKISAYGVSQGKIYILQINGEEDYNKSVIYQENLDGSEKTTFMSLDCIINNGIFIDENYLYYVSQVMELAPSEDPVIDFDTTSEETDTLHRINLKTKQDDIISDEEKGYWLSIKGYTDGVLYYSLDSYGEMGTGTISSHGDILNNKEPVYKYIHEDDNRHEVYAYNCETETTERILENKTIYSLITYGGKVYFYESPDGKNILESYDPKTKKVEELYESESPFDRLSGIDNNLFFVNYNNAGVIETNYYDLKSKEVEKKILVDNDGNNFRIVSESDDLFVLRRNCETNGPKLYYIKKSDFYSGNSNVICCETDK